MIISVVGAAPAVFPHAPDNAACLVVRPFPRRREGLPRKIRELVRDLIDAGFTIIPGGGKGSHRKFTHPNYPGGCDPQRSR